MPFSDFYLAQNLLSYLAEYVFESPSYFRKLATEDGRRELLRFLDTLDQYIDWRDSPR